MRRRSTVGGALEIFTLPLPFIAASLQFCRNLTQNA